MRNKVNKLFEAVTPFRLCFDLGLSSREHKNGWYAIDDPHTNKNFIFFNESEFVSSSYHSDFTAGNIVDFLVYYKALSYKEAIQYILDIYINKLNTPILSSIRWSTLGIADYLEKLNTLLLAFKKASQALSKDSRFSRVRSYLNQYETNELFHGKLAGAASGTELNELLNLLDTCQHIQLGKARFSEEANYLLLPFFANRHLISKIEIINVDTNTNKQITIIPYRYHFFGLHNSTPGDTCVNILDSVDSVL